MLNSEQQLKLIIESGNIGTWDWDLLTNKVVWNDILYDMLGIFPDNKDITAETFFNHIHPEDRQRVNLNLEQVLKKGGNFEEEFRVIRNDGQERWLSGRGKVIRDENGKAVRMTGINFDITAIKAAEEQIQYLARFPKENPFPVLRILHDGTILYSNSTGGLLLKDWGKKINQKAPDKWQKLVKRAYKSNTTLFEEIQYSEKIFSIAIVPIIDEGYVNLYGSDITAAQQAEHALNESEHRFRQLLKMAPIAMCTVNKNDEITYLNDRFIQLFGYSLDEIPTREKWRQLAYPDETYRQDVLENWQSLVEQASESHTDIKPNEYNITCKDGTVRIVIVSGIPIEDGFLASFIDITERKQAEDALRQSREDLARAQSVGQIGSWRLDTIKNELTWSEENHRIFGLPKGTAMTYETFLSAVHPDDLDYVDKKWKAALAGKDYDIEHRIIVNDKIKWVREKAYLEIDKDGNLLGGFGITQDITNRKEMEDEILKSRDELEKRVQARTSELSHAVDTLQGEVMERMKAESSLKESEKKYRDLIELSPEAISVFVKEKFELANAAALRLLKAENPEQVIGKSMFDFIDTDSIDTVKKTIEKAAKGEIPGPQEVKIKQVDGSTADIEATAANVTHNGKAALLVISHDITERKLEESRREVIKTLLELFVYKTTRKEYLDSVVQAIADFSSCECVGIRVVTRDGYIPYESHVGFGDEFMSTENMLSLDSDVCMCVRIVTEKIEPQDLEVITNRGSFKCSDTFGFAKSLSKKHKQRYRGNCAKCGYGSVAVIPIRYRYEVLGALHIADKEINRISSQKVEFLENMAMLIGEALHRFNVENELLENEERYRSLVTASSQIVWNTNAQGEVVNDLPTWHEFTGQSTEETKGWGWLDAVHPDDQEAIKTIWLHCIKTQSFYETEYRIRRHDGQYRYFSVRGVPILERNGSIREWIGTCTDVTERKHQQDALEKSQLRLSEAQRIAHLGNWEWNLKTNEIFWSSEVYRIFGISQQDIEVTSEVFSSHIHPDDRDLVIKVVQDAVQDGKSFDIDFRIKRTDGAERIVHEKAEVIYGNNHEPIAMTGIVYDITEQRKAEDEIRKNQIALRELTANLQLVEEQERRKIAQDLHDSIGQILAFSSMKIKNLKNSTTGGMSSSLDELAKQLDEAISQSRSLSFDLSPSTLYDFGLETAIEDLVDRIAKERNIQYQFENFEAPLPLSDDVKVLLYRCVRELLINMVKHANASVVKVSILRSSSDIYIKIEDNGDGFDVSILNNSSQNRKGFGIFSIRERLDHIGGQMKIKSKKSRGTTVILTAPLDLEMQEVQEF